MSIITTHTFKRNNNSKIIKNKIEIYILSTFEQYSINMRLFIWVCKRFLSVYHSKFLLSKALNTNLLIFLLFKLENNSKHLNMSGLTLKYLGIFVFLIIF